MADTLADWTGGLTLEQDLMFPARPDNPDMRESASIWLFEENGEFGFPRIGIEAEAEAWEDRRFQANFAFRDGRILNDNGRGPAPSSIGPDGRATVLGAGPLTFRCVEPFRKWIASFDGEATDSHVDNQIAVTVDLARRSAVRFEAELTMVTPAWVQDNSPERVARMSEAEAIEAANMGIGYRIEHLFRAEGWLEIDGRRRDFKATGSRIHRQSVRPMAGFRGHCWQSAVFPDGRAFGYIAYPPREDGSDGYNEGYLYVDGRMIPARAVKAPWLRRAIASGDDATVELESELGITRIEGVTTLSTFRIGNPDMSGFNLQQTGARYSWDGQVAHGMLERSSAQTLERT